ncbi:YceI family protein [Rhodoferax sp. GW822-FHT02A01]|uniref:YceI family protein n=1 Tax=Rhodoferax sp. GW822-FHT02A01 TaxID=3141537 RepID=UPI00315D59A6
MMAVATGAAQAETENYAIDPSHTFVTFEIGHFGASTNRGRFDRKEGSVQLDRTAKVGKVEISIDMTSVSTGTEAFNKFLQGFEIFDSATYPTAKFMGDKFSFSADNVSEVAGTLTLLGKTNPVVLKANQFRCYRSPVYLREVCGGDFEATIDRVDWGMNYGLIFGFPRTVHLVIQVEAIKQ